MSRISSAVISAAFCLALAATPAAAETVSLSRDGMLALAVEQLRGHEPGKALALANAVLEVNPNDIDALLLRSRALKEMGQGEAAVAAAEQASALADTTGSRQAQFAASVAMAQALAVNGNHGRAQIWLRRAFDEADTNDQKAYAAAAYRYVRQINPWRFNLAASFSPNQNINNGSSAKVIWIAGLPFTPLVYSGYTAEVQGGVSYRFDHAEGVSTTLGLSGYAAFNWLDAASKTLMATSGGPSAGEHDFDYVQATMTLSHQRVLNDAGQRLTLEGGIGTSFYGWSHYANFATIGAELATPLGANTLLTPFVQARGEFFDAATRDPIYSFSAGLRLDHRFESSDTVHLEVAALGARSATASREYNGARVKASWDIGRRILGTELSVSASAGYKNYPVTSFLAGARRDFEYGLGAQAALPGLAYRGFMPVISLDYEKTNSNVAAYQTDNLKLGLGIRSQF